MGKGQTPDQATAATRLNPVQPAHLIRLPELLELPFSPSTSRSFACTWMLSAVLHHQTAAARPARAQEWVWPCYRCAGVPAAGSSGDDMTHQPPVWRAVWRDVLHKGAFYQLLTVCSDPCSCQMLLRSSQQQQHGMFAHGKARMCDDTFRPR